MAKFNFRLEKVLEFRASREKDAKTAYLEKRTELVQAETLLSDIQERRGQALSSERKTIEEFRMVELTVLLLDDEERAQRVVIMVLNNELEGLRKAWAFQKRELEMVGKLKEKAREEWQLDEDRREQAELDEWSVLRRAA